MTPDSHIALGRRHYQPIVYVDHPVAAPAGPLGETMNLAYHYARYSALCDKGSAHSYIPFYDALFAPLQHRKINFLEIGVWHGGSIMLWNDFFTHKDTRIYGIDVMPQPKMTEGLERYTHLQADITDDLLLEIMEGVDMDETHFNVILDDGAHTMDTWKKAWERFNLKMKGLYIIEDPQTEEEAEALAEMIGGQIFDFRYLSGRYDDMLIVRGAV